MSLKKLQLRPRFISLVALLYCLNNCLLNKVVKQMLYCLNIIYNNGVLHFFLLLCLINTCVFRAITCLPLYVEISYVFCLK